MLKNLVLERPLAVERRDLSAALRFYCGRAHEQAHDVAADAQATGPSRRQS
jgi:hypothetical protein